MEWIKKYEPKTFEDIILHPEVRRILKSVLSSPRNVILSGRPGTGKSTFTKIFVKDTGFDEMQIDASVEGKVALRKKVIPYCSVIGFLKGKVVVFKKAECLSQLNQKTAGGLMETAIRTTFIFMTDNIGKISEEIVSHCGIINFNDPPINDILTYMEEILNSEGIASYEKEQVSKLVDKHFPDIRKTINELENLMLN